MNKILTKALGFVDEEMGSEVNWFGSNQLVMQREKQGPASEPHSPGQYMPQCVSSSQSVPPGLILSDGASSIPAQCCHDFVLCPNIAHGELHLPGLLH